MAELVGAGFLALGDTMLVFVLSTVSRKIYFKAERVEP